MHWHSNWHCQINDSYITLELEYHIKDTIYQQKMKKHLSKQKQYSQKAFDCIDWYAIEKAAKTLTLRQQILVTKYASVFFAHGDRMYKRGLWENYICPICARRPETANHIITCDDIKSISQYDTSIKKILIASWLLG